MDRDRLIEILESIRELMEGVVNRHAAGGSLIGEGIASATGAASGIAATIRPIIDGLQEGIKDSLSNVGPSVAAAIGAANRVVKQARAVSSKVSGIARTAGAATRTSASRVANWAASVSSRTRSSAGRVFGKIATATRSSARRAASWAMSAVSKVGDAAGSSFAAARAMASSLSSAIGPVISTLSATVSKLAGPIGALKIGYEMADRMSEQTNAQNRQFARWSPMLSSAFARQDIGDQMRQRSVALATEGTGSALADAITKSRDSWKDWDIFRTNLNNRLAENAAGFTGLVGAAASYVGRGADMALDAALGKPPAVNIMPQDPWSQQMLRVSAQPLHPRRAMPRLP